jgi:hypothetical protein
MQYQQERETKRMHVTRRKGKHGLTSSRAFADLRLISPASNLKAMGIATSALGLP